MTPELLMILGTVAFVLGSAAIAGNMLMAKHGIGMLVAYVASISLASAGSLSIIGGFLWFLAKVVASG